jgi:DNA polymerase epsilon subunit 1
MEIVKVQSVSIVVQDLKCLKCQGVKETNMADYCTCAGRFTETISLSQYKEQLKTFKNISQHFKMPLLEETVIWLMNSI